MSAFTASDANEVEYQFECDNLSVVDRWLREQPAAAALQFVPGGSAVQNDTYYDTEDWAVSRSRFTLRVRRRGNEAEATLKSFAAGAGALKSRREINQPLIEGNDSLLSAPGPVSDRVRLLVGDRNLRPLFTIITHRQPFEVWRNGSLIAELTLDDAIINGYEGGDVPLKRVELEERQPGSLPLLESFIDALVTRTGLRPAKTSKFQAGLLAAGLTPPAAPDVGPTDLQASKSTGEYAHAVLRAYFLEFLRHEPGTRLGDDPEELHDMRVAARRLRAAMSAFAPALPPRFTAFRNDLRGVARALGAVRDLDVQIEQFTAMQDSAGWDDGNALAPLVQKLREARRPARKQLLATLDGDAFATLVRDLSEALRAGRIEGTEASTPVSEFGRTAIRRRYRKFRTAGARLTPHSDISEFHRQRVRGKKLRYTVEFFRPIYGKRASRMIAAVTDVQDALGEMHDCAVAMDWLRKVAAEERASLPPATLLLMGALMERRRMRIEALREQWPDVFDDVRDAWRSLRKHLRQERADEAPANADAQGLEPCEPSEDGHDAAHPRLEALLKRVYRRVVRPTSNGQ